MAYHTQGREPLLDSDMVAMIEQRSKELVGFGLVALGLLVAALLYSYSPNDPNLLVSTDAPAQNWLGRTGASIAAISVMTMGLAGWAVVLVCLVWGVRYILHKGQERALGRLVFAPIWLALVAAYAATLNAGPEWYALHKFGLGGLGGDLIIGFVLTVLPIGSVLVVKLMSFLMALGVLVFGCFVLGFNRADLWRAGRWLLMGLVMFYALIAAIFGRGGAMVGRTAAAFAKRERAPRRSEGDLLTNLEQGNWATQGPSMGAEAPQETPQAKQSLLGRMPGIIKRPEPHPAQMPEPELVETQHYASEVDAPDDSRVKARIADAIRARVQSQAGQADPSSHSSNQEPAPAPGSRLWGLVSKTPAAGQSLPAEPPLTAQPSLLPVPPAPDKDAVPFQHTPFATDDATPAKPVVQHPPAKPMKLSAQARAEAQPSLAFEDRAQGFELPALSLLTAPPPAPAQRMSDEALEQNARMLESVLDDYGVKGEIVSVRPGPVVTMYELEPAPGLKASRVIGLADDIARSMMALSARVSTVPGRSVIGIELPNETRETVFLREILSARDFGDTNQKLPLALGKDIGGGAMVANLAKMPHLLIAGTTGSGKSVAINTMILSLLYKLTPEDCRLIMIDPKMLELSVYDGIPHLLSPVVTDPKKAVVALKWVVGEMEERYRKMSKMGVRNIDGYNGRVKDALAKGELFSRTVQTGFDDETGEPVFETEEFEPKKLPFIVVIVDEMADLMMVAGKEIEACIQRLAQMARASGIHLIMATQRPSVDVITGTIKANFPTRISFQVTSKIDSRTILGEMGAEQLLGMGDMLYMAGGARITRCHAPFVSDEEVEEVVRHLKAFGPPDYVGGVVDGPDDEKADGIDAVLGLGGNTGGEDALYDQAVAIVIKDRKCSTSYIQRKLAIGYNKAARLVEQMEDEGVVSPANHVGKREILVPEQ